MYCLLLTWVSVWDSAPYFHSSVSYVNFVLWWGVQKYFLYAQMTIQCVECAITEIYLLLVARNLLKYMLLFIFLVLRHIALLVASSLVARNWSLAWAWFPSLYLFVLLLSWVKLCQLPLYMYIHTQVKLKSVHDVSFYSINKMSNIIKMTISNRKKKKSINT